MKDKAKKLPKPKQKRRARGTGSIFPNKRRGGYKAKVPVGKYPSGETRYKEVSGKTQAEVIEKMKGVSPLDAKTATVKQWADRWIAGLGVRTSTEDSYVLSVRERIIPELGDKQLSAVSVSDVKSLTKQLLGPGELAPSTVVLTLAHGQVMFEAAVLDELIARNPFALAPRPEVTPKEIDPFTPEELLRIADARSDLSSCAVIAMLAVTGCRLGEASALDVTDWNAATSEMSITKTWSKRYGSGPPKSKYSKRVIEIPPELHATLNAAVADRTSGPLFRTREGNRVVKSLVQRAFKRLLTRLKLRPRNPHQLRHSVATGMISCGIPVGDVAKYIGDSVQTVVRVYLHDTKTSPAPAWSKRLRGEAG